MQFTLSKLFLAIAMLALACAGMMARTRWWAEAIVALSIVLYMAVALSAIGRDVKTKIFRIVFAAVGGGYLLLVLTVEPIRQTLLTDHALIVAGRSLQLPLDGLDTSTLNPVPNPGFGGGGSLGGPITIVNSGGGGIGGGPFDWEQETWGTLRLNVGTQAGAFFVIGHCVWSWLLALLAACFAAYMRPNLETTSKA